MTEQIKPLNSGIACIWDHDFSDYPDRLKIPMHDGQIITYHREIEQPHPSLVKAQKNIRKMKAVIGYQAGGKDTKA
ncbi:MAG: hypothetical protein II008_22605 [Oscillospiraceae bacterium]|nr:hypothetical protein [Oscillospiraceae bacterium]